MIEPSIPEDPEDASMPAFSNPINADVGRRDSAFSMDGGFSFRRPSMQSALSFDTPNSSVASFHHHQSPNASVNNFHLNHSPNASVASFHNNSMTAAFQPSRSPNYALNGGFPTHRTQSPSASVSSFQQHPSASVSSFNLAQPSPGLGNYLQQSAGTGMLGPDTGMDMSGRGTMLGFAGMTQGNTPTGSYTNLDTAGAFGAADFFGTAAGQAQHLQQQELQRVASHSSLEGALGGFYMS